MTSEEALARRTLMRWAGCAAVVGAVILGNVIYGAVCDSRCGELCAKEGFPVSSWNGESGFWTRSLAAMKGKHGTCWCRRERWEAKALSHEPGKELRLTFGN